MKECDMCGQEQVNCSKVLLVQSRTAVLFDKLHFARGSPLQLMEKLCSW